MSRAGWMPDSSSTQCYECGNRFTALRRKHHCRICGRIFCNRCSDYEVPGKVIGQSGFVRACQFCMKTVNECSSLNRTAAVTTAQDSFSSEIDAATFTRTSGVGYDKDRHVSDRLKPGRHAADDSASSRNVVYSSNAAAQNVATSSNSQNSSDDGRTTTAHPFGLTANFASANNSNNHVIDTIHEDGQNKVGSLGYAAHNRSANNLATDNPSGNPSFLNQFTNSANLDLFRLKWADKRIPQRDVPSWLVRFRSATTSSSSARISSEVVAEIETKLDGTAPSNTSKGDPTISNSNSNSNSNFSSNEAAEDGGILVKSPIESASHTDANSIVTGSDDEYSEAEREPDWFRDLQTKRSMLKLLGESSTTLMDREPSRSQTPQVAKVADAQPSQSDDVSSKDSREELEQSNEVYYDAERLDTASVDRFTLALGIDGSKSDAPPPDAAPEKERLFADVCLDNVNAERYGNDADRQSTSLTETDGGEPIEPAETEEAETGANALLSVPIAAKPLSSSRDASPVKIPSPRKMIDDTEQISAAHEAHLLKLIRQLVASQYLPASWTNVVYKLCGKVTRYIDPTRCAASRNRFVDPASSELDFAFNSLSSTTSEYQAAANEVDDESAAAVSASTRITDIRNHVHIKKVPSRKQSESAVIFGVVASKNAALRSMPRALSLPRVLVLRCSLEYQRAANKYAAFDLQIEQERDFLRNVVERILELRPTVVVVEHAIAQLALEMLKQAGNLVVLTNVKSTVVDRIVQLTRAEAVQSVEALMLITQPMHSRPIAARLRLGTCEHFRIVELPEPDGTRRSLMYFEHVPRSNNSIFTGTLCSVELGGADYGELRRVKRVLRTALFATFHSRLELAFLADAKARLRPEIIEKLTDENEDEHEMLARFRPGQADVAVAVTAASPAISSASATNVRKLDSYRRKASCDPLAAGVDNSIEFLRETSRVEEGEEVDQNQETEESQTAPSPAPTPNQPASETLAFAFQPVILRPQTVVPRSPFALILDDVLLSISPFVHPGMPYLQQHSVLSLLLVSPLNLVTHTPCALLVLERVDPTRLYWSVQFESAAVRESLKRNTLHKCAEFNKRKTHSRSPSRLTVERRCDSFLTQPLTDTGGDLRDRLAQFRANAGTLVFDSNDLRRGAPWNCSNAGVQQILARQGGHLIASDAADSHKRRHKNSEARKRDCLSVTAHQRIALLYCFFATESTQYPAYCNEPAILLMRFYGENDMSVRRFLTEFCFTDRICGSCRLPMDQHIRRFVHANGCVHVSMKLIDKLTCVSASAPVDASSSVPDAQAKLQQLKLYCANHIATWRRCKLCARATKIVMFSNDASQMSFGKFLEMCFRASAYQLQHAAHGTRSASTVQLCDHALFQDFDHYFAHRDRVVIIRYSEIALREICLPPKRVSRAFNLAAVQKSVPQVGEVRSLLSGVQQFYNDLFELIRMNGLMDECFEAAKREYEIIKQRVDTLGRCVDEYAFVLRTNESTDASTSPPGRSITPGNSMQRVSLSSPCSVTLPFTELSLEHVTLIRDVFVKLQCELAVSEQAWNMLLGRAAASSGVKLKRLPLAPRHFGESPNVKNAPPSPAPVAAFASSSPLSVPASKRFSSNNVSNTGTPSSTFTVAATPPNATVSISTVATTADGESAASVTSLPTATAEEDSSSGLPSVDAAPAEVVTTAQSALTDVKRLRADEKAKSVLSGFLRVFVGEDTRVFEMTYPTELHPLLPVGRPPVLVNDQQPTSIIAYALASDAYSRQLDALRKQGAEPLPPAGSLKHQRSDKANASRAIELEFSDESTNFYCKVYYAAEFDELRRLFLADTCTNACCSGDAESFFVRSLSRCAKWRAPGGKSGSAFCKTFDERFVLKELNSFEIQSFLQFAPHYFEYMREHAQTSSSTSAGAASNALGFSSIVKIFGFFRLGHKNMRSDSSSKQDVLIMENLFYGKRLAQVFDLKGSMRNRLTKPTGGDGDLVLQDENLLKMSIVNPFYVRSHSKQVLLECIRADTEFLARHEIIDYSLLVGVTQPTAPAASGELVVGIIDIIRQFTWDKRIESVVKASGLLGGKGQMPTIVNPELYRKRFIEAMDTYFLVIPDSWYALGETIDLARKPRSNERANDRAAETTG